MIVLSGFEPEAYRRRAFVGVIEQQIFPVLRQLQRRREVPFGLIEYAWLEARAAAQRLRRPGESVDSFIGGHS